VRVFFFGVFCFWVVVISRFRRFGYGLQAMATGITLSRHLLLSSPHKSFSHQRFVQTVPGGRTAPKSGTRIPSSSLKRLHSTSNNNQQLLPIGFFQSRGKLAGNSSCSIHGLEHEQAPELKGSCSFRVPVAPVEGFLDPALCNEETQLEDRIEQSLKRPGGGGREQAGWWGNLWEDRQKQMMILALPALALPLGLEGPESVIQALAVLAAIITVHEAGHFLAARLQGIHVTKFAIGFGPMLAKYQGKKVEYSLRAFPLGGFVAFPDNDPESSFKPDDPYLLKNRPIPARALVISAGVLANILFAYTVLFSQVLTVGLVEQEYFPGVVVPEVIASSAAAKAGLQAGDVVTAVNGHKLVGLKEASVFELVDTIKANANHKLSFSVQRESATITLRVVPDKALDGSGRIGVQLAVNGKPHRVKAENLADATVRASKEFSRLLATVLAGLQQIFLNFAQTADKLSGPVAIVAVGAEVARADIAGLFQFAAIVNINLAVVNLLPLPALDGGYLALIALEALRGGKKLPDGIEQGIMSSGVLLLLALGVVLMVRDTINLGIVQQML
jgi:membrane-associated protease RseP (regulator of RpoE activity)